MDAHCEGRKIGEGHAQITATTTASPPQKTGGGHPKFSKNKNHKSSGMAAFHGETVQSVQGSTALNVSSTRIDFTARDSVCPAKVWIEQEEAPTSQRPALISEGIQLTCTTRYGTERSVRILGSIWMKSQAYLQKSRVATRTVLHVLIHSNQFAL